MCKPNYEILTSISPYYMPKEFSNFILNITYIPESTSWWISSLFKKDNTCFSSTLTILNTCDTHGTVSSPILLIVWTHDCRADFKLFPSPKYSDEQDQVTYNSEIEKFIKWYESHYFQLNVKKLMSWFVELILGKKIIYRNPL